MSTIEDLRGRLWSDEPSRVDFLAARAIAETVSDAVLDDALDPLAIGLSGPWGSGKTTVLELIKTDLDSRSDPKNAKIITVRTDPWRYDPAVGAKESLIGEVLDAIAAELAERLKSVEESKGEKIKKLLKRLSARVDWAKTVKLAAKSSLTLQIPGVSDVLDLIREPASDDGDQPRGLAGFKAEFAELLRAEEMGHVRRVAVLVDDLDRCLVDTVVETLEAIRLFLSVEGMAFVIAADEDRVADAIRTRLPDSSMPTEHPKDEDALPPEPPSKLYLHKIVQTTVPLPALGAFDTESYVLLLQLQNRVDQRLTDEQLEKVIAECHRLRATGALDDLRAPAGIDVQRELSFARRLTTVLYEKLRGNPRRIKRFLNDLNIRRSIAARRGIELDFDVVAKLMVLEVLSDGWSDELLLREISTRYTALESGEYPDADEPATSYLEFAEAQHEEWIARRCGAIDRLGSVTEGMIVPSLFPHGAGRPYDAAVAQVTRTLSDRCAARLEAAAGLHRMTPFTLLLACTALAVIDERDVPGCLIGSNVANRVDRRFRGTVGYLTNTRVVPVEAWREAAFAERLRLVRDAWLDASRWDSVYAKPVLDALDNPEVLKIDLLETCSNASRASWGEAVPVSVPLPSSPCNHWRDLTISWEVSPAGIHLSLRYRLDTVPPADAERLVTKVLEHLERGCEA